MEIWTQPPAGADSYEPSELNEAIREHGSLVDHFEAENKASRTACYALAFSLVVAILFAYKGWTQPAKVLVVHVEDNGRARYIDPADVAYQPRQAEMRYFTEQFVVMHYSRNAATFERDYMRSLYLLNGLLMNKIIAQDLPKKLLKETLQSQTDADVVLRKWMFTRTEKNPFYQCQVDYDLVSTNRQSGGIVARQNFTATIDFDFTPLEKLPRSLITSDYNPLGMEIRYFRSDEGSTK